MSVICLGTLSPGKISFYWLYSPEFAPIHDWVASVARYFPFVNGMDPSEDNGVAGGTPDSVDTTTLVVAAQRLEPESHPGSGSEVPVVLPPVSEAHDEALGLIAADHSPKAEPEDTALFGDDEDGASSLVPESDLAESGSSSSSQVGDDADDVEVGLHQSLTDLAIVDSTVSSPPNDDEGGPLALVRIDRLAKLDARRKSSTLTSTGGIGISLGAVAVTGGPSLSVSVPKYGYVSPTVPVCGSGPVFIDVATILEAASARQPLDSPSSTTLVASASMEVEEREEEEVRPVVPKKKPVPKGPFVCPGCGDVINTYQAMGRHYGTCQLGQWYLCPIRKCCWSTSRPGLVRGHLEKNHPGIPPIPSVAAMVDIIEGGRRTIRRVFSYADSGQSVCTGADVTAPLRGYDVPAVRAALCEPCFAENPVRVSAPFWPVSGPVAFQWGIEAAARALDLWPDAPAGQEVQDSGSSTASSRQSRPRVRTGSGKGSDSGSERSQKRSLTESPSVPRVSKAKRKNIPATRVTPPVTSASITAVSAAGGGTLAPVSVSLGAGVVTPLTVPGVSVDVLRAAEVYVTLQRKSQEANATKGQRDALSEVSGTVEGLAWLASVHTRLRDTEAMPPPKKSGRSAQKKKVTRLNRRARKRDAAIAAVASSSQSVVVTTATSNVVAGALTEATPQSELPDAALSLGEVTRDLGEVEVMDTSSEVVPDPVDVPVSGATALAVAPLSSEAVSSPVFSPEYRGFERTLEYNEPATRNWVMQQLSALSPGLREELRRDLDQCLPVTTNKVCVFLERWYHGQSLNPPLGEELARGTPRGERVATGFRLPAPAPLDLNWVEEMPGSFIPPVTGLESSVSAASSVTTSAGVVRTQTKPVAVAAPVSGARGVRHVNVRPSDVKLGKRDTQRPASRDSKPDYRQRSSQRRQQSRTPSPASTLLGSRQQQYVASGGAGRGLSSVRSSKSANKLGKPYSAPTTVVTSTRTVPTPLAVPSDFTIPRHASTRGAAGVAGVPRVERVAGVSGTFTQAPTTPDQDLEAREPHTPSFTFPSPGLAQFFGRYVPVRVNESSILGSSVIPEAGVVSTIMMLPDPESPAGTKVPTAVTFQLAESVRLTGRVVRTPMDSRDRQRMLHTAVDLQSWIPSGPDMILVNQFPVPTVVAPTSPSVSSPLVATPGSSPAVTGAYSSVAPVITPVTSSDTGSSATNFQNPNLRRQ